MVAPLEKKTGSCRSMKVLGAKYTKMLWLVKHLDLSVLKENISLSAVTWTVVPTISCIIFHSNHVQNNTQIVLKVSDLDLKIKREPIKRNIFKEAPFHAHFESYKHGMSDWEITLINQTESVDDLRSLFCSINSTPSNQNGLNKRDVALSWCVYLLHYQWFNPLYLL